MATMLLVLLSATVNSQELPPAPSVDLHCSTTETAYGSDRAVELTVHLRGDRADVFGGYLEGSYVLHASSEARLVYAANEGDQITTWYNVDGSEAYEIEWVSISLNRYSASFEGSARSGLDEGRAWIPYRYQGVCTPSERQF